MAIDKAKLAALYEILTGKPMARGAWDIGQRDFAQKILHIEEACRSTLEAIEDVRKCRPGGAADAVKVLRTEFRFLGTLHDRA